MFPATIDEARPQDLARPAPPPVPPGLKGLVVADTALGDVRGDEGFYHYRQYSAPDLARSRTLEDVWSLLLDGVLPTEDERRAIEADVARRRVLPGAVHAALPAIAAGSASLTVAVRTGLSHLAAVADLPPLLDCTSAERREQVLDCSAALPTLVAALHRLRSGRTPIAPGPGPLAADYLRMLGIDADGAVVRALEQYLILGIDHGFNASTFTARTVASTGTDMGSALVAGLGALLGPLHGGAPSRALDTLDTIGTPERTAAWVRSTVRAGGRIMGFGHPVYRTEDPRSVLLRSIAQGLGGDLVDFAVQVEAEVEATLAELKPDRVLRTNVEWYAAVVMDRCGLDRTLFTPTFAVSRVIGWGAHVLEQVEAATLIRPSSRYVGPTPPCPVPDAAPGAGATGAGVASAPVVTGSR